MELTKDGRRLAEEVAQRHAVSTDAVMTLLQALAVGGGTQAQFSHPDLGGMGQWSQGGMTMVGDMFNNGLKAKVDSLCSELSSAMRGGDVFSAPRPVQNQSQSGGQPGVSLFVSGGSAWPAELGAPSSSGSQNNLRYAFFPSTRRLLVDVAGQVTIHDTGDHVISGVSQQQGGDQSLTFTSQNGLVRVEDLPVVGDTAKADSGFAAAESGVSTPASAAPVERSRAVTRDEGGTVAKSVAAGEEDVFAKLERVASLHEKGILTDGEFESKKAELLARI